MQLPSDDRNRSLVVVEPSTSLQHEQHVDDGVDSRAPDPTDRLAQDRWSFRSRLSVFVMLLLATVVGAFGAGAYNQVRSTTISRDVDRLKVVGDEVATLSSRLVASRVENLELLASNPEVVQLAAGSGNRKLVDSILREQREESDSALVGWEIWAASGSPLLSSHRDRRGIDSVELRSVGNSAMEARGVRLSNLFFVDSQAYSWTVFPISDGKAEAGFIAELRQVGTSTNGARSISQLIGQQVTVFFANTGPTDWVSILGRPSPALFDPTFKHDPHEPILDARGQPQFVTSSPIVGTPWRIVLVESASTVLSEPHVFLRRIIGMGLFVLVAGTLLTWLIGRHLTRPLGTIGAAADAFSRGDYSRRVEITGAAEIARLGESFNTMASRIEDAHGVLAHQNSLLKRANESKTRFLAMMSHELRTPLNAIGGYTDLLALGIRGPTTLEQTNDLARIRRNKDQLLNIIGDILHFARVDAGQINLKMKSVKLIDVFRLLEESIGPQFVEKGVELKFEQTELAVAADAARLQQVLLNLITNAYSFTSPGGSVSLSCELHGSKVQIHVRDNGIGIPADRLLTIFEPFVQVDASLTRKIGGTGLGLAIVRELTTAMGGTIDVESTPGLGSTFTVSLERATPPSDGSSVGGSPPQSVAARGKPPLRV